MWLDKKCLEDGQKWADGFANGLFSSYVFVPILSKDGLANFATLHNGSARDNVLLEYLLALEQLERRKMLAIFPVFVGPIDESGAHQQFFEAGALPGCTSDAPAVDRAPSASRIS